jgi:phosphatidylinositol glycan class A protein
MTHEYVSLRLILAGFTIVVLCRLVYRKGMDLLLSVIPAICARFPHVQWIIGGDGPKRVALEEMREKYGLHHRMIFLGAVPHDGIRNVLTKGHLFVNASLTEAFCIAILEAVSAGLFVVSTRVGGVPEILPTDAEDSSLAFADPVPSALIAAISEAIPRVQTRLRENPEAPFVAHERVKGYYNWHSVSERTEKVYDRVREQLEKENRRSLDEQDSTGADAARPEYDCYRCFSSSSLLNRLPSYRSCGTFAGVLFAFLVLLDYMFLALLEWWRPAAEIERAVEWPKVQTETEEKETRKKSVAARRASVAREADAGSMKSMRGFSSAYLA